MTHHYHSTPNLVFTPPGYYGVDAASLARSAHPQPSYRSVAASYAMQQPVQHSRYYTAVEKPATNMPTVMIIGDDQEGLYPEVRLRYVLLAALAGTLFSAGWWFAIDATVVYVHVIEAHFLYHSPGFAGTMAFLVVNVVTDDYLSVELQLERPRAVQVAKLTLFAGWSLAFGALIGATYIMVNSYFLTSRPQWPGIAVFMQNFLIFLATLTYRLMQRLEWRDYYLSDLEST